MNENVLQRESPRKELISNGDGEQKIFEETGALFNGNGRQDYLKWGDYFMAVALLAAQRSKDPCTQVGACIVNSEKKIVGIGYNGMPNGCDDNKFPWGKDGDIYNWKSMYVCHAEMNAIINKNTLDLKNCTIYVGRFPCNECAKIIIQSGICEVIYLTCKDENDVKIRASKRMFESANVKYKKHIAESKKIVIEFPEDKLTH